MTKALRSYPFLERLKVVARRLKEEKGGLGFLAAQDFQKKVVNGQVKPPSA